MSIPPATVATLQPQDGCTIESYASAKGLPPNFLQGLRLTDMPYMGHPAIRMPYLDEAGNEIAVRYRTALVTGPGVDMRFRWKSGSKPTLYGRWRLKDARAADYVVLVEGESDAHTLWHHGIPAVGLPGAGTWKESWGAHLEGIPTIYLVVEPDRGGEAVLAWLSKSAIRDRVRLVHLAGAKDPSALFLEDRATFRERWAAALEGAQLWATREQAEADARRVAAWSECSELAHAGRILDRFAGVLRAAGVAGEERAGQLLYLCLTSRLLDRPVSAVRKGPSAAGKSFVTERVLSFFPPEAYYVLTAMSERALAYSEVPLAHRMLVLHEAAGVQGDMANYLLRSLLSEGRVRYETVEKTPAGLQARTIDRPGPTGVILTTTAVRLHPETETRLLSISVTDSPEQTRQIMRSVATGGGTPPPIEPWHALQTWLQDGERRVLIPFAAQLAELTPPTAVRLRRDFRTVLDLIRTHALLHQATRERDPDGRIVAALEDYDIVRELVQDLIAEGVEASVPDTVRETVRVVAELARDEGVNVAAVAKGLKLEKSSALRRVRQAQDRGYLRNEETRRGHPARLSVGDPLPDEVSVLPFVGELREDGGCTVASVAPGVDGPPSPRPEREAEGECPVVGAAPPVEGAPLLGPKHDFGPSVSVTAPALRRLEDSWEPISAEDSPPFPDGDDGCGPSPGGVREERTWAEVSPEVAGDRGLATASAARRCLTCGGTSSWLHREGGGWTCARCHPAAGPDAVAEWGAGGPPVEIEAFDDSAGAVGSPRPSAFSTTPDTAEPPPGPEEGAVPDASGNRQATLVEIVGSFTGGLYRPERPPTPGTSCARCGGRKFWLSTFGTWWCEACRPPDTEGLVTDRVEVVHRET
jgi:hypothetical protein